MADPKRKPAPPPEEMTERDVAQAVLDRRPNFPETRPGEIGFETLNVLRELHRGTLLSSLDSDLTEVVDAVKHTGKKGKLTLVISIEPETKAPGDDRVMMNAEVKLAKPRQTFGDSAFWADRTTSALSREDPTQLPLDLRVPVRPQNESLRHVDSAQAKVRKAKGEDAE